MRGRIDEVISKADDCMTELNLRSANVSDILNPLKRGQSRISVIVRVFMDYIFLEPHTDIGAFAQDAV